MSYDSNVSQNAPGLHLELVGWETRAEEIIKRLVDFQLGVSESDGQAVWPTKANMATYAAALMTETGELLNEVNWKPWKKHKEPDLERVADEWADVTAFYLLLTGLICRATGLTPDQLVRQYFVKSAINVERLNGRVEGYGKDKTNENSN